MEQRLTAGNSRLCRAFSLALMAGLFCLGGNLQARADQFNGNMNAQPSMPSNGSFMNQGGSTTFTNGADTGSFMNQSMPNSGTVMNQVGSPGSPGGYTNQSMPNTTGFTSSVTYSSGVNANGATSPGAVNNGSFMNQGATNTGSFMNQGMPNQGMPNQGMPNQDPSMMQQSSMNGGGVVNSNMMGGGGVVNTTPMNSGGAVNTGMSGGGYVNSSPMQSGSFMNNGSAAMPNSGYSGNVNTPMNTGSMPYNSGMNTGMGTGGYSGGGHPLFNRIRTEFTSGGMNGQQQQTMMPGQMPQQQQQGAFNAIKGLFGPPQNVQEAEERGREAMNLAMKERQEAISARNNLSAHNDKSGRAHLANEVQNHAREARAAAQKLSALASQWQSGNLSQMASQANDAANYAQNMADQAEATLNGQ
ncbi:MAG TPA: hypothetical protein V6C81_05165 [Planktothrix sp.]|jgi:hypothetical protein